MLLKYIILLTILSVVAVNSKNVNQRNPRFFSWLFGPQCKLCPPNFCEDDPAVVLGYCCGCRPIQFQEFLPIQCPPPNLLVCPVDSHGLCRDYEYMMACCCS